jgi:hypothetical protein
VRIAHPVPTIAPTIGPAVAPSAKAVATALPVTVHKATAAPVVIVVKEDAPLAAARSTCSPRSN